MDFSRWAFYLLPGLLLAVHLIHRRLVLYLAERRNGCRSPPRPAWDPLLGLDVFLPMTRAAARHRFLAHWHENMFRGQARPTMRVDLMGCGMIWTNEPRNVHAVLATRFADFGMGKFRRDNSYDMLGDGLFNADGEAWAHARAMVRPNLARRQVADLDLFERHFGVWMDSMAKEGKAVVDIQEWAFRFTLDVATELLFGETVGILKPDATEAARQFDWKFEYALTGLTTRFRLGQLASFHYDRKFNASVEFIHSYVDAIVDRAMARFHERKKEGVEEDDRYVFMNAMIKDGASRDHIRFHCLELLVAARDTTAALISTAVFVMARRPDVQDKLRAEIGQLNGELADYDDIKNMSYLGAFVKETLRLYPPGPVGMRQACRDTILPLGGGPDGQSPIFVQEGDQVAWQTYSMHRRRDFWGEDAEEFRPERWRAARPMFEFLPFNAGPRICPGQQLALVYASYVLSRLLQTFPSIRAADDRPWMESLNLTLRVAQGVLVDLKG